jgi:hypothetical protein
MRQNLSKSKFPCHSHYLLLKAKIIRQHWIFFIYFFILFRGRAAVLFVEELERRNIELPAQMIR